MARDIYALLNSMFGGTTASRDNPELAGLTNVDAVMLKQDPTRVAFWFCNLGAAAVFIRHDGIAAATAGIQVPAGGVVSFSVRDDFDIPAREWHAVSPGGNQSYTVTETRLIEGVA